VAFGRGDVNLQVVAIGATVWKTDDPVIRRRLESTYRRDILVRRRPIRVHVEAAVGEPLRVRLADERGHVVEVSSDAPLARAEKHALTASLLREQFGRLGDTPFELGDVELNGPDGPAESVPVMAPKSVLNDLRRKSVAMLMEKTAATSSHAVVEGDHLGILRAEIAPPGAEKASPRLAVLCRTEAQLEAALRWQPPDAAGAPAMVYCDFVRERDYGPAVARAREAGRAIGLAVPTVLHPGEESLLDRLVALSPDVLLVRNLGAVEQLRRRHPQMPLIGDYSLNAANELAAAQLARLGLVRVMVSYDVNKADLGAMAARCCPSRLEVVVHQHAPMFHTRHCLFAAYLSDLQSCEKCDRPCCRHEMVLRDRNNVDHPVVADCLGRTTVFNGGAQSSFERLEAMRELGVGACRIELLNETADEAIAILERCALA
jgi:putative protease